MSQQGAPFRVIVGSVECGGAWRRHLRACSAVLASLVLLTGCASDGAVATQAPVARTVTGEPLTPTVLSPEASARLDANLAAARAAFENDPNELNTIWLGRRLAYLQRYPEAIAVYSEGLQRFPDSYRLLRHRGHRHISRRDFAAAVADFEAAYALMPKGVVEIEPDGIPNAAGIPLSSTQFNVLYHLALAQYLRGDYEAAAATWRECLDYSPNPDLLVATTDWLWMTLRRLGDEAGAEALLAPITPELEVIENDSYLKRLRMYRGELDVDALLDTDADDRALALATQGYGVANWYLVNGDAAAAMRMWEEIEATGSWSAFGYIAAEVDRARGGP